MAAITQQRHALWGRRYGSFAGKTLTPVNVDLPSLTIRTTAVAPAIAQAVELPSLTINTVAVGPLVGAGWIVFLDSLTITTAPQEIGVEAGVVVDLESITIHTAAAAPVVTAGWASVVDLPSLTTITEIVAPSITQSIDITLPALVTTVEPVAPTIEFGHLLSLPSLVITTTAVAPIFPTASAVDLPSLTLTTTLQAPTIVAGVAPRVDLPSLTLSTVLGPLVVVIETTGVVPYLMMNQRAGSMRKNTAGQTVSIQLTNRTTLLPQETGTAAVFVTKDGGGQAPGAGSVVHEGNGEWSYFPTQEETDGDHIAFTFVHALAFVPTVQFDTELPPQINVEVTGGGPFEHELPAKNFIAKLSRRADMTSRIHNPSECRGCAGETVRFGVDCSALLQDGNTLLSIDPPTIEGEATIALGPNRGVNNELALIDIQFAANASVGDVATVDTFVTPQVGTKFRVSVPCRCIP